VIITLFDVLFPDRIRDQFAKSQPSPHYAHGSAMGFFVTLTFH